MPPGDPQIVEVPYAADDAVDLARLFALELGLVAPERTVVALAGEPQKKSSAAALEALVAAGAEVRRATLGAIYRLAWDLGQGSGERGLFVVSVASHGFADQGAAVLAVADTVLRRRVHTGLRLDVLLDDVTEAEAPRRLVLVDACRERFSARTRAGEADPASAMGDAFREAIARARGLATLAGTTFGGYAYDDPKRKNGVFTAALCDGLRGKAPADERHFVTLEQLTRYVDERVRRWVKRHRSDHRELSRGVAATFDPDAVRQLPLALDPRGLAAAVEHRRRRDAALARLRGELDPPLTGAIFDDIRRTLEAEPPPSVVHELLTEIEALDGSVRMRRALVAFFHERRAQLGGARPAPAQSPRPMPAVVRKPAPKDERAAGELWEEQHLGLRFRFVPPGTFQMGSPEEEVGRSDDETLHQVTLSRGLWVAETVVTQAQWRALMEINPSKFSGNEDLPVETVSWYEALAFANALSQKAGLEPCYELGEANGKRPGEGLEFDRAEWPDPSRPGFRLPTEAEWEYAARAGTSTPFWTGGDLTTDQANYDGRFPYADHPKGEYRQKTVVVRSFEANPRGLYEVHGNVFEWVWDVYGAYSDESVKDPTGPPDGSNRVIRGGSWDSIARNCRSANRGGGAPGSRYDNVGFRLVRTA